MAMAKELTRASCLEALTLGADWLEGIAQEHRPDSPDYGSLRTNYTLRDRKWRRRATTWHTGQAGRALLAAHKVTSNSRYLKGAERAAAFLVSRQILDPSNPALDGLVVAHDQRSDRVSVAAMLRAIRLFADMADLTGEPHWQERFLTAMQWVLRNAYLLQGKVMDSVSPETGQFDTEAAWGPNTPCARPLIDEACFHEAFRRSGEASYERAFSTIANRLADEEDPPGHWAAYPPSDRRTGLLDAHQAFWWARPMLVAGEAFGDARFIEVAERTAQWFMDSQNLDGGFYRRNWTSGYHDSFDLSSSAAACAVLLWLDFYDRTSDEAYLAPVRDSLGYLLRMQFAADAEDVNVRGAFIESLSMPPLSEGGASADAVASADGATSPFFDGTDKLSVHVADVAAGFAVQALARAIETPDLFAFDRSAAARHGGTEC
jgi:hypothetical protein